MYSIYRDGQTELPSVGYLPKCLERRRMDQARGGSRKLRSPTWVAGSESPEPSSLPDRVHISRKLVHQTL